MSGRKSVTVDEREYRRLLEDRSRLRQIQNNLPEIVEAVRWETSEDLRRRLEPVERRQRDLQQALQGVIAEVREFEEETVRRIVEQEHQMRDALRSVRQEIAEQARRFNEMMEQERRIRQQQIHHLQEQVDAIVADQRRREELARSWIEAAEVMRGFIEGNYRHQQFAPGALERLERDIRQARENVQQGVPETALAQAQAAYRDLSDLRLELERLEREWNLWRAAALESAREILSLAQSNRRCKAVGLDAQEIDVEVEVDWWTDGKLTALEQEVQQLIARIQEQDPPMTTEQLRQIAESTVPSFQERLEEVVREARLAVLGSQLRINIADLVVRALEEQGFALQDATYEGEDMRGGYVAKVKHLDGSEIVVTVTPKEGEPAENELNIHSYDVDQRSEHELRQRARELAQALQAKGLQTGEPRTAGDARPDPTLRDMDEVRKRQPRRIAYAREGALPGM